MNIIENEVELLGNSASWEQAVRQIPTIAEERWQVVDEGDHWAVWFVPLNHVEEWREIGSFPTEKEAIAYVQSI